LLDGNESRASFASLDAWILASWPRAVVYAESLLRDRPGAEDVVQDCICNLLRKSGDYDLLRDGVPLLMKSVTHACLKKNAGARPMLSLHSLLQTQDPGGGSLRPEIADPPSVLLHAELEQAIETALARIPENQRAAVELKALGHSLNEIAEMLAVTPTNAGVLVFRGRQGLARQLAPYLEGRAG
jgi:RNA polymerase sigma factor (sigma-70 family)